MENGQIESFTGWIEDTYGTPEELAKILDYGIEMLFYLEEDTFDQFRVKTMPRFLDCARNDKAFEKIGGIRVRTLKRDSSLRSE
ncbi:MAG: hypothetical protein R2819_14080 [Allomuricauda sp.]